MQWYEKFKVGQRVRVIKKVGSWRYEGENSVCWNKYMDGTLDKVYEVLEIKVTAGYRLHTQIPTGYGVHLYDYFYPVEALACVVGQQLLFSFYYSIKG